MPTRMGSIPPGSLESYPMTLTQRELDVNIYDLTASCAGRSTAARAPRATSKVPNTKRGVEHDPPHSTLSALPYLKLLVEPRPPRCFTKGGSFCGGRSIYAKILVTTPAPTVRPPSRIAKRSPSSIAMGL